MNDNDTSQKQDTEHHLRGGGVPVWHFWNPGSSLVGGLLFGAVVFGLPAILFVSCGDIVAALEIAK